MFLGDMLGTNFFISTGRRTIQIISLKPDIILPSKLLLPFLISMRNFEICLPGAVTYDPTDLIFFL